MGEEKPSLIMMPGVELLNHMLSQGGVPAWNNWVNDLAATGLVRAMAGQSILPAPLAVMLDFGGADLSGRDLDGVDLSHCSCAGANFTGSSLKSAQFGHVARANFRDADLEGCCFLGSDLDGCIFTGATTNGMKLEYAGYHHACPPVGLPESLLSQCSVDFAQPQSPASPAGWPLTVPARVIRLGQDLSQKKRGER